MLVQSFLTMIPNIIEWNIILPNKIPRELDHYRFLLNEIYTNKSIGQRHSYKEYRFYKKEKFDIRDGWVSLHYKSLEKIYAPISNIIKKLIELNIIECNGSYCNAENKENSFCLKYRTNPDYEKLFYRREFISTNKPLLKKLNKRLIDNKEKDYKNKVVNQLRDNLHRINIKYDEACSKIDEMFENNIIKDFETKQLLINSIDRIEDKIFNYSNPDQYGRHHTNITNLKRELRQYLYFNDKNIKLINIDICNSQPFFLSTLLNKYVLEYFKDKIPYSKYIYLKNLKIDKQLQLYRDLTTQGKWYGYVYEDSFLDKYDRKKDYFKFLFSAITWNKTEAYNILSKKLPSFIEFMTKLKQLVKDNDKDYLPKLLQKIESYFMFDLIIDGLFNTKLDYTKVLTIHDSILIEDNVEMIDTIELLITKSFEKFYIKRPKTKLER